MAEYTQEQLDKLINDKIEEARKGLFTEEDLKKRITSETDRRVESGIQKGLETQKQKWEKEYSERLKLSAEELAKKDFDEKFNDLSKKELAILKKANHIEAKDMLSEAQIPKAQYEKIIGMLVSDDTEVTKANVQNFIDVFNNTKVEIETKVKSEFGKIPPPSGNQGKETTTKEEFIKMPYSEKLKLKQTKPELYATLIK